MKQAGISLAEAKFAAGDFSSVELFLYYVLLCMLLDILLFIMWTRLRAK